MTLSKVVTDEVAFFAHIVEGTLRDHALTMTQECSHPPCLHAAGLLLAVEDVRAVFARWVNDPERPQ